MCKYHGQCDDKPDLLETNIKFKLENLLYSEDGEEKLSFIDLKIGTNTMVPELMQNERTYKKRIERDKANISPVIGFKLSGFMLKDPITGQ